jgi:UDP-N-acetylmuramate dehydrogenase
MNVHAFIRENVLLAPFTTLEIGGAAKYFAEARSEDELLGALSFAERRALPVFVLGGGSNVLVADEGFAGLVLRVALKGVAAADEAGSITAGAGEDWDEFVAHCVGQNLAGLECLSGIPGLVGGTPVQNVGAYGQEVSETITAVRAYDRDERRVVEFNNAACEFGYRRSVFNSSARERYVVLAVTYALKPGGAPSLGYADVRSFFAGRESVPSLQEVREAVRAVRARKAMLITPGDLDCRSAGSFFKNPVVARVKFTELEGAARRLGLISEGAGVPHFEAGEGKIKVPAAWLIERAGFRKGYRRGRAAISSKHTLALVNLGGATAAEVLTLAGEVQARVREVFGVTLMPEPVFVGFDPGRLRPILFPEASYRPA